MSMPPSAPIPTKLSARAGRDAALQTEIRRVWDANFQVYGVRKVWRQLQREAIAAPRCQVARLMKQMGLAGAVRGKTVKTTHSDKSTPCPLDRVNRQFRAPAPNALWLSDFTYVATWQGFVYVAFVIDAFARRIVGWRVSRSARADFVLDALEQALCDRRPVRQGGLVHHSDRGVQYVSIRYTERLRRGRHRALRRQRRRQLRQCARRDDQRPVQDRGDPSARPVAQCRDGGIRHSRMGRLVQQSSLARTDRKYPARRSRRRVTMPRPDEHAMAA